MDGPHHLLKTKSFPGYGYHFNDLRLLTEGHEECDCDEQSRPAGVQGSHPWMCTTF